MTEQLASQELLPATLDAVSAGTQVFSFGDPTPVLGGREVFDYLECWFNGRWYEPPLSLNGLARSVGAGVHLHSGLMFKRNLLSKTYIPHPMLSRAAFEPFALDFLCLGNGYLEKRRSLLGNTRQLVPSLARYMRVGPEGRSTRCNGGRTSMRLSREALFICVRRICTRRFMGCRSGLAHCSQRY